MPQQSPSSPWWGAPKRFDNQPEDRHVSWLELFYDLVYVIAMARITHVFAHHLSWVGFLEYGLLFTLIYWGWLNGSMYTDLHGSRGLRTRLMTLWQMMIIAAFAILYDHTHAGTYQPITLVFMVMQLYITYMWWSVGFYDRSHRRYNQPYTVLYLLSFAMMGVSLFMRDSWLLLWVPVILVCNYTPPFLTDRLLRKDERSLDLSSSMFERLGLFTIIVFGELVLGVVNGISSHYHPDWITWLNFALSVSIVFIVWWLFTTFVSRRRPRKGFTNASLLELMYIPSLLGLGLIAAAFSILFDPEEELRLVYKIMGFAIGLILICIRLMHNLLEFPEPFRKISKRMRISFLLTGLAFFLSACIPFTVNITIYLAVVLAVLGIEVIYVNSLYYGLHLEDDLQPDDITGPE